MYCLSLRGVLHTTASDLFPFLFKVNANLSNSFCLHLGHSLSGLDESLSAATRYIDGIVSAFQKVSSKLLINNFGTFCYGEVHVHYRVTILTDSEQRKRNAQC